MQENEIGIVTHFYGHIGVGIIKLSDSLKVGETIHIKGHSSDFTQIIDSLQIEHLSVQEAKAGDFIGVKVIQKVHPNDKVYRIVG